MKKQILTENYYGRKLEVTITSTAPELDLKFIPDSVKKLVWSNMADDVAKGSFSFDVTFDETNIKGEYVSFNCAGSWRFIELDYELLMRIVLWKWNHFYNTALTEDKFIEKFGESYGKHFYEKWKYTYKCNLMEMIGYFKNDIQQGQEFCDLLMEQVVEYEQQKAQFIKSYK